MDSSRIRQEPWWTLAFTLSPSLRLQPTQTLLVVFSYILCMSRTSHCSIASLRRGHQTTRPSSPPNSFLDQQRPYTVSCWWHGTFNVTGVKCIWRQWCCHQAWSQTACHRCTLVVIRDSQPPSLDPSWPDLAIWGIDNFLAQGLWSETMTLSSHSVGIFPKLMISSNPFKSRGFKHFS